LADFLQPIFGRRLGQLLRTGELLQIKRAHIDFSGSVLPSVRD
jgi:hypothetical protein